MNADGHGWAGSDNAEVREQIAECRSQNARSAKNRPPMNADGHGILNRRSQNSESRDQNAEIGVPQGAEREPWMNWDERGLSSGADNGAVRAGLDRPGSARDIDGQGQPGRPFAGPGPQGGQPATG